MSQSVDAVFSHGQQTPIDYRPSSAKAAGTLLSFGTGTKRQVGVVNCAIAADQLGSYDVTGIYHLKKKTNVTFENGETVEWDEATSRAVDAGDGSGDFAAGVAVADAAATDDTVLVKINEALSEPGEGSS